jgi:hypothetical protein
LSHIQAPKKCRYGGLQSSSDSLVHIPPCKSSRKPILFQYAGYAE